MCGGVYLLGVVYVLYDVINRFPCVSDKVLSKATIICTQLVYTRHLREKLYKIHHFLEKHQI